MPLPAQALLMGDNGPEAIWVELRPSLRLSLDLDSHLQALAAIEAELGLTVVNRFVGPKYLEVVSFPSQFSYEQALAAVVVLQQQPFVERVTPVSVIVAYFAEVGRRYAPNETIPEAVRRGLDLDPDPMFDPLVVLQPHVPKQLIVKWRAELVWNAERTGFLERIVEFNASLGCRVVEEFRYPPAELTQLLEFSGRDSLLASKLQRYVASRLVKYVQPNFILTGDSIPRPPRVKSLRRNPNGRALTHFRPLEH